MNCFLLRCMHIGGNEFKIYRVHKHRLHQIQLSYVPFGHFHSTSTRSEIKHVKHHLNIIRNNAFNNVKFYKSTVFNPQILKTGVFNHSFQVIVHNKLKSMKDKISHVNYRDAKNILQQSFEFETWNITQLLIFCDVVYHLGYLDTHLYSVILDHICTFWKQLNISIDETVQMMFYISINRAAPHKLFNFIDVLLLEKVNFLNGNEISLLSYGFFVCNHPISDVIILQHFCDILLKDVAEMPLPLIVNIVKILRQSRFANEIFLHTFGNSLCEKIVLEECSLPSLMHISQFYSALRYKHDDLFYNINNSCMKKLEKARPRLKDLSRFIYSSTNLCFEIQNELLMVLEKTMRKFPQMINKDRISWYESLTALIMNGAFPFDLIDDTLKNVTLQHNAGLSISHVRQIVWINTMTQLKLNGGTRLKMNLDLNEYFKNQDEILKLHLNRRKDLNLVHDTVSVILGGSQNVACHFSLPSSQLPDLEFHIDENCNVTTMIHNKENMVSLIDDSNVCSTKEDKSIISSLIDSLSNNSGEDFILYESIKSSKVRKVLVKVLGQNQMISNVNSPLGFYIKEGQLLSNIGYDVFLLFPKCTDMLSSMTQADRCSYLSNILKLKDI